MEICETNFRSALGLVGLPTSLLSPFQRPLGFDSVGSVASWGEKLQGEGFQFAQGRTGFGKTRNRLQEHLLRADMTKDLRSASEADNGSTE
jgi:hypothetical protein